MVTFLLSKVAQSEKREFFFACLHRSRGDSKLPTARKMNRRLRSKKEARKAGWKKQKKTGGQPGSWQEGQNV